MGRGYENSSPYTIGRNTNASSPSAQFLQNRSRSASSNAEPFSLSSPGRAAVYSDNDGDEDYDEDTVLVSGDALHLFICIIIFCITALHLLNTLKSTIS